MRILAIVLLTMLLALTSCGGDEDETYCQKLDRCDLLDTIYVDNVDECLDRLDEDRENIEKYCGNHASRIKKSHSGVVSCLAKRDCGELEDYFSTGDTICNDKLEEISEEILDHCEREFEGGDDDSDDADFRSKRKPFKLMYQTLSD